MIKQAVQPFSLQHFGRLLFQNRKKAGLYGLCFVGLSLNLCLFLSANMHTPAAARMNDVLQLMCFGIMGVFNVWVFNKRNFLKGCAFQGARLAFISLLFVLIVLVLFLYYYFSGNNGLIMAFASSGAFLLPFLIFQGWMEYSNIPEKTYPVWQLPSDNGESNALPAFTVHTMQVHFSVLCAPGDETVHIFPVTVSGKTKLGRVFENFVKDSGRHGRRFAIAVKDPHDHAFEWQFFEKKWAGLYSKNLNPAVSLHENYILPNATIHVVRTGTAV
ncbi:MAG: TssN family type VI secretion system protein [Chitinophagaceae bacterium]